MLDITSLVIFCSAVMFAAAVRAVVKALTILFGSGSC